MHYMELVKWQPVSFCVQLYQMYPQQDHSQCHSPSVILSSPGPFRSIQPILERFATSKSGTEISAARSLSVAQSVCDLAILKPISTDLYPFWNDFSLLKVEQKYPQKDHSQWHSLSVIRPFPGWSRLILTIIIFQSLFFQTLFSKRNILLTLSSVPWTTTHQTTNEQ